MTEDRVPVVVASGQVLERDEAVSALDLAERASLAALDQARALRDVIQRVSVVGILSPTGPGPASALSARVGLQPAVCETTSIGGNTPQMLVNRASSDIAAGRLSATLIAGGESMRSVRAGHRHRPPDSLSATDDVVGDNRAGVGAAESAIGLVLPVHIYAMFESAIAERAGRSLEEHRAALGRMLAPFSDVAAEHPVAWFPQRLAPDEIARPDRDNRIVAEPYTKRMSAFLNVDQGAALIVCSLAAARAAGVAERAVFVHSGAENTDVWEPVARPNPGESPAIRSASRAALDAAGVGLDDVAMLDLYSCFPSAVEAACSALGIRSDDRRGLTVTGGLPYFGGPGNNYSTHAIATMTERLRDAGAGTGMIGALGWYITKHAFGVYGASPRALGFVRPDTTAEQAAIDASALPVTQSIDGDADATVVAATVVYDGESVSAAPVLATLPDGRRVAASASASELAGLAGAELVGRTIRVCGSPLTYEVIR